MSVKETRWPTKPKEGSTSLGRDLDSGTPQQWLSVTPPTAATVKRAQRYVASESHDGHRANGEPLCDACVADARELLDMLGLLP